MRDPNCRRCGLWQTTSHVYVAPSGPESSVVSVVGEAPGHNEELQGTPFVGAAGQLLNSSLGKSGLDRHCILVTNACRCRPPGNRTPKASEFKACSVHTQRELQSTKFVLLLGSIALKQQLGGQASIKKLRGKVFEKEGKFFLPTYHPAYIIRDARAAPAFDADLRTFKKLVTTGGIPQENDLHVTVVDSPKVFHQMLDNLSGIVSLDIETSGIYAWAPGAHVVSVGLGTRKRQWVWPILYRDGPKWRSIMPPVVAHLMAMLAERLQDCQVVGQFCKFDSVWLKLHYNVDINFAYDVGLAHYQSNENSLHDLEFLAQIFYSAPAYDVAHEVKQGISGTFQEHVNYLAKDIYYTRKLRFDVDKTLTDHSSRRLYYGLTLPASSMYRDIELTGVTIDVPRMQEVEQHLLREIDKTEKSFARWGKVNLSSPQQLSDLLFTKLRIKPLDMTPTGKPSTNESVLKRLDHPCVDAILKHRRATKLYSTFIKGWKPFLIDGKLHPSFKIHGTTTGRPSCESPNFQQTDRDTMIRSLVIAPKGWELVEFDLSQAELRIVAELSRDPTMLEIFQTGGDIHRHTASVVLDVPPQDVDDNQRYIAKSLNFGLIYGMYEKKLIQYCRDEYGVNLTRQQSHRFRTKFFQLYSKLLDWHERQKMFARQHGYVRNLCGRMRRLPIAMQVFDSPERGEADRQAINSPVQSFVSDMNLMICLQASKEFPPEYFRLCATVHDSGMAIVRRDKVMEVGKRLMIIMQRPALMDEWGIKLRVLMVGDVKVGPWSKGVKLEKWQASNKSK
jgi:uracil-DNA glycosylase family 4